MSWRKRDSDKPPVDWSTYKPGFPIELVDIPITARGQAPQDGSRFSVAWTHNQGQIVSETGYPNVVHRFMLEPSCVFLVTRIVLRFDDKQPVSTMGQGRMDLILGSRVYGDWPLFLFADSGTDAWYTFPLDRPLFIGSQIPVELFLSDVWPGGRFYSLALCGDRGRPLA